MAFNAQEYFGGLIQQQGIGQMLQPCTERPVCPMAPVRYDGAVNFFNNLAVGLGEKVVYSQDGLIELLGILEQTPTQELLPDELQAKYRVRYVITTDWKILFAKSGVAVFDVPNHREMARQCLAAGYIEFDPDYQSVVAIDITSNVFAQTDTSLVWTMLKLDEVHLNINPLLSLKNNQGQLIAQISNHEMSAICASDIFRECYASFFANMIADIEMSESPRTPRR